MVTSRHATDDDEDLIHLYLVDIGRHPLLTKRDEVDLAQRIEAGAEARDNTRVAVRAPLGRRRPRARRRRRRPTGRFPVRRCGRSPVPGEIAEFLAPLTPRERKVLTLRFGLDRGEPRTLEEVGVYFELTRERIRQIEAKAMAKLRHPAFNAAMREQLAD